MTIDERLERLTERHEALAQTVEMLAHEVRQLAQEGRENFSRINRSLSILLQVAENHEQRLERLEGK